IVSGEAQKAEVLAKGLPAFVDAVFTDGIDDIPADTDIVLDLLFENEPTRVQALAQWLPRPVIVNAVIDTLDRIGQPFIRLNAWPGFLLHPILEITPPPMQQKAAQELFTQLGWNCRIVPDIPGMVSARVIAMIINEAWYTYGDGISTREEIDTAMKLGTNYPQGPFVWGEKIGAANIRRLLEAMHASDSRYEAAPALKAETTTGA
ncbi:MAG: hypothetical protein JST39_21110, partial [Bacteroidetes bacterium]|nr:hypothetical protein [Bacteroidota bacterium]